MPRLVVDANVIVQSSLSPAGLGPLSAYSCATPPIGLSEAVSSLHELRYRGTISEALAQAAITQLLSFPVETIDAPDLRHRAWSIADQLGWAKTYDAEYVALAQILDCQLISLDGRLARGASKLVRVMAPTDINAAS